MNRTQANQPSDRPVWARCLRDWEWGHIRGSMGVNPSLEKLEHYAKGCPTCEGILAKVRANQRNSQEAFARAIGKPK